jgi:MFS family permease
MDILMAPIGLLGLMAGLLFWSRLSRFIFGIMAAAKNSGSATLLGELTDHKLRKMLAYLFVASCAWISIFALLTIHYAAPNTAGTGWAWFFGGVAITPLVIWATTLRAVRKIRRRKVHGTQS